MVCGPVHAVSMLPPVDCPRHACLDRSRHSVGRRRQRQGGRLSRGSHGLRGPIPGRQQRGPHRHRRGSAAEVAADPLGHPVPAHHIGDRRRRRGRSSAPDEGDGCGPRDRRRCLAARRERQRAHDHALPPRTREGHGALPRQERARHDETRYRAGVRRQGRAHRPAHPGPVRREDLPREVRRRAAREEPDPHQDLQPPATRCRAHRRGVHVARRARPAACGRHERTDLSSADGRQAGDVRRCPGRVARPRPRHVSVRDVVEPGRGKRARERRRRPALGRAGGRHHEGLRDPRGRRAVSRPS